MRDQAGKQELYKKIWTRVKGVYRKGFCVSERGLQAALYTELQKSCQLIVMSLSNQHGIRLMAKSQDLTSS